LAGNEALLRKGVRAADGLHMVRAMFFDADLVIATDGTLLGLDRALANKRNEQIRCCDTDIALTLLR